MNHSFSHKGKRVDVEVLEQEGQFEYSYMIEGGTPVRKDDFVSRSSASAVLAAMAAAKKEIDSGGGAAPFRR
ncbi:hypothetical protein DBV14_04610 [Variovorax sp. KBW07]|uniref:hypothetical protein n=1 Tax=Variovorax sp. KBW07 TaxID=2153358 RepID=UPI000F57476C|nr:hypothetical protein [Variovorax sp. KBW07]RQO61593.1 hypothetical protein DBV14_04610 [Variovorax sp. KBW07]